MNDGTYKIIVNIKDWEKVEDEDLRALLRYMNDSIVTNDLDMRRLKWQQ